jgi:hypothetical protein
MPRSPDSQLDRWHCEDMAMQYWMRRNLGNFLFGLWLVLLGLLSAPFINMIQHVWVNVILGVLLIIAGVFHLIDL